MANQGAILVRVSSLFTWGAMLVMTQLLVTQWTVRAAGNRDVIDYVSFAGTVVGMILAILAIVYSYLANASQRSDAETLRLQIANLNDAVSRAQASESQFASEVGRLEEIREAISAATNNSAAALETSSRIEEQMKSLHREMSKPAATHPSDDASFPAEDAVSFFATRATLSQLVLYYLAVIDDDEGSDAIQKRFLELMTEDKARTLSIARRRGEISGYYWMFYDLGVFMDEDLKLGLLNDILAQVHIGMESDAWNKASDGLRMAVSALQQELKSKLGD